MRPSLPRGIWLLGFVSLLMDTSSELVHSLLPTFLVTVLGAGAFTVGVIEGVAESTAQIVKVFSGPLSDFLGKRKPLAVLGYGLGALSKPLFALAPGAGLVFGARFVDRIGKGIRGAPRDALVADLAPPSVLGAAYGLRQTLDSIGAVLGPLLAIGLMILWDDVRAAFWVAAIPGALAVALLAFGVKEPAHLGRAPRRNPIRWAALRSLGGAYWWVAGIGALFSLSRFSEAFLLLRAQQLGLPIVWVPLVLVTLSAVFALSAYPLGKISDHVGHTGLLAFGLIVLIGADLVLGSARSWPIVFVGVALWGLHLGATQGLLAAMVAKVAPTELRGTAFGIFNLLSGVAALLASVLAGLFWDRLGPSYTFLVGAGFCVASLAVVALRTWVPAR